VESSKKRRRQEAANWLLAIGAVLVLSPVIADDDPVRLEEQVTGDGRTITVVTVQGQGTGVPATETVDQCITRHTANVNRVIASLGSGK